MAAHPDKHIRDAMEYAKRHGWTFQKAGPRAHIYGTLYCELRTREGHRFHVHSTPASPQEHARRIRRAVDRCEH